MDRLEKKSITVNELRKMGADSSRYAKEEDVRLRVLSGVAFLLGAIKKSGEDKDGILHGIIADAVLYAPARQKGYSCYRDIIAKVNPQSDYDDPVYDLIDLLYIEGCKIVEGAESARMSGRNSGDIKIYEAGLDKFEPVLQEIIEQSANTQEMYFRVHGKSLKTKMQDFITSKQK